MCAIWKRRLHSTWDVYIYGHIYGWKGFQFIMSFSRNLFQLSQNFANVNTYRICCTRALRFCRREKEIAADLSLTCTVPTHPRGTPDRAEDVKFQIFLAVHAAFIIFLFSFRRDCAGVLLRGENRRGDDLIDFNFSAEAVGYFVGWVFDFLNCWGANCCVEMVYFLSFYLLCRWIFQMEGAGKEFTGADEKFIKKKFCSINASCTAWNCSECLWKIFIALCGGEGYFSLFRGLISDLIYLHGLNFTNVRKSPPHDFPILRGKTKSSIVDPELVRWFNYY